MCALTSYSAHTRVSPLKSSSQGYMGFFARPSAWLVVLCRALPVASVCQCFPVEGLSASVTIGLSRHRVLDDGVLGFLPLSVPALNVNCAAIQTISWVCIPFWAGKWSYPAAHLHNMVLHIFTLLRRRSISWVPTWQQHLTGIRALKTLL